jgi:hypothetical protein
VAVLRASLIRGLIIQGETSSLSHILYELVFLIFAIVMVWVKTQQGGSGGRNHRANCPAKAVVFRIRSVI